MVAKAKGLYGLILNLPWELLWSSLKFFMISLRLSLYTNNMWKEEKAIAKEQRGRNEKYQGCRKWNVNFISTVNNLKIDCYFWSITLSDSRSALWGVPVLCGHFSRVFLSRQLTPSRRGFGSAVSSLFMLLCSLQGYMLGREGSSPAAIEVP